ncbi:MAG: serine hydrolase [Candidatus Omnitrophica bacterium]|nr:serine hydrolase [Candidatus Omnitrophota bacterium]
MRKKYLYLFLGLALCGLSYLIYANYQQTKLLDQKRKASWAGLEQKLVDALGKFNGDSAIVIKDLQTGWTFTHQQETLFPAASLSKIPIMAVCFLKAQEQSLRLSQTVKLKSQDKLGGSGVLKGVKPGTVFTVDYLIGLMITESDNTATNILTNMLGLKNLDSAFRELGLAHTNLSRKVADYRLRKKGVENYTTAGDMAFLLEKIYRKQLINQGLSEKCIRLLRLSKINDRILKYLPAEISVAHKTGLERSVCHDAGIVFTAKGDFLICVLTKHKNSNSAPAKELIGRLALDTYNYFSEL